MQTDIAQHLTGVLVVARELRTTVVVVPSIDGVDALLLGLLFQFFHQPLSDAVYTAHSRYHPYLVAHTYITILTYITLKGAIFFFDGKFLVNRLVCVFERTR